MSFHRKNNSNLKCVNLQMVTGFQLQILIKKLNIFVFYLSEIKLLKYKQVFFCDS